MNERSEDLKEGGADDDVERIDGGSIKSRSVQTTGSQVYSVAGVGKGIQVDLL